MLQVVYFGIFTEIVYMHKDMLVLFMSCIGQGYVSCSLYAVDQWNAGQAQPKASSASDVTDKAPPLNSHTPSIYPACHTEPPGVH